ncbi:MAG: hypothetical protein AAB869_02305 [Patescibacteria group bacterium]
MKERVPLSLKFITGFSIAGLLFSGYLSAVRFFSAVCAFNEGCPYFLGLPACYYGFVMYILLTLFSIAALRRNINFESALVAVVVVAFLGILFAGYFTAIELPALSKGAFASSALGVPTCFLGLVFYMLIFVSAALGLAHHRTHVE